MLLSSCPTVTPYPTFDPALLSATTPPTSTLLPTYTPFPTTQWYPTRTAIVLPTIVYTPKAILTPLSAPVSATPRPPGYTTTVPLPTSTPTSYIGIPGIGPEMPDLEAVLTISSNALCNQWFTAQVGVYNAGNAGARDVYVEWSFGWNGPQSGTIPGIDAQKGIYYVFSGETAVQCAATSTYQAYLRIDPGNTIAERSEDNNTSEETIIVTFGTPGP
jgi:hypothetical protein